MLLESSLAIVFGFLLLVWSADRFVAGASSLARNLGVSPMVIGLTIVGFGTSAPEMLVSVIAALDGNPSIAVGNALGSNITNIGLVVGTTALLAPITVKSDTLRREFPLMFAVIVLTLLLMMDQTLSLLDSLILLTGLVGMIFWVVRLGLRKRRDPLASEFEQEIPKGRSTLWALSWLVVGLTILMASSKAVVWGSVNVAQYFGISDLVIGLTIIAIGTSLPELAASILCVLRKEDDMAIGNIIGSNMFNLLGVMGVPGLITAFSFEAEALSRDFTAMFILTLALYAMSFAPRKGSGRISRIEGTALLAGYTGYMVLLYFSATGGL